MKRLILFVEGPGDEKAVPRLVNPLITELGGWQHLSVDKNAWKVKHVHHLARDGCREWKRLLQAASVSDDVGGVLLLLDGDADRLLGSPFCVRDAARLLALKAREVQAGSKFSVACVFACMEYESWLIGGLEIQKDARHPDGRSLFKPSAKWPVDPEKKRGAKEWLRDSLTDGYKEIEQQDVITQLAGFEAIRDRKLKSFARLERAIKQLVEGIASGKHVATP